jgi:predicted nucleic acid-binding protein
MLSSSGKLLLLFLIFSCSQSMASAPSNPVNMVTQSDVVSIPGRGNGYADKNQVPDSLQKMDAVVTELDESFQYLINTAKANGFVLYQTTTLHKKIKIQTKKGLNDYSKLSFRVNRYSVVDKVAFHIIRPDGATTAVDPIMHRVQEMDDNTGQDERHLKYSIPGVEIGDVIEIELKITNPCSIGYPMEVYLNEEIPVMNYKLTLKFSHQIVTQIKTFNDLPLPPAIYNAADSIYSWSFDYLDGVPYQNCSIRERELPFVRYMLTDIRRTFWSGITVPAYLRHLTWGSLFEQVISGIQRPNPRPKKVSYFKEFMESRLKNCDSLSKIQQFRKIYQFIQDSMKVVNTEKYENYSSGYYLYNRQIDRYSLFLLYEDVLKYFHFKRYFVFGKYRYAGDLDQDMISTYSYSCVFMGFREDSASQVHYIIPRTSIRKFEIDELDPELYGTRAFLVKFVDPDNYTVVRIPSFSCTENSRTKDGRIQVDPETNILKSEVKTTYSGAISTGNRIHQNTLEKDSLRADLESALKTRFDNFRLDSVTYFPTDPLPPFSFSLTYKATQENILSSPEEKIIALPLSSWLGHDPIPAYEANRTLDFYPDFPYSEKFSYRFSFPYAVDLINDKPLQCSYDNDYGAYHLSVKRTDERTITVESEYIIKSDLIPQDDYRKLKEINDHWESLKDSKMMIRRHEGS